MQLSPQTRWTAIVVGIIVILGIVWAANSQRRGEGVRHVDDRGFVAEARDPEGDVTLIRDEQEMPVAEGIELENGDIIRTKEGSVSLEFFAGSRVALDGHTQLRVDDARVNDDNQRVQNVEITVLTGRIWSRVLKLLEIESSFRVNGGNITATVRGTAFAFTSRPGVAGNDATIDLFDGRLGLSGMIENTLEAGFTFTNAQMTPTPDETRNDPWIRAQMAADKEFIERVSSIRRNMDDKADYSDVGDEAGPFTLDDEGHSGYQSLEIREASPDSALTALKAIAHFYENSAFREEDVTHKVTWQVSDPSLVRIAQDGTLTILPDTAETFTITARWNDGTHEHSATVPYIFGEESSPSL